MLQRKRKKFCCGSICICRIVMFLCIFLFIWDVEWKKRKDIPPRIIARWTWKFHPFCKIWCLFHNIIFANHVILLVTFNILIVEPKGQTIKSHVCSNFFLVRQFQPWYFSCKVCISKQIMFCKWCYSQFLPKRGILFLISWIPNYKLYYLWYTHWRTTIYQSTLTSVTQLAKG